MKNVAYLTFLSILSALAVVFLHFNGVFWARPSGALWISSNLIEATCFFAVPIFFMISGCNLLNYRKRYTTADFLTKRLKKIFLPFLLWSTIALGYAALTTPTLIAQLTWSERLWGILDARFMPVYWFFMPLLTLYLIFPLLAAVENKIPVYTYCLTILILMGSLLPFLQRLLNIRLFPAGLHLPFSTNYLIYPLLGYLLDNVTLPRKVRHLIYLGGLLGLATHFTITLLCTPANGPICTLAKGYTNPPTLLYAAALFLFAKETLPPLLEKPWMQRLLRFFGPTTFGIYLCHMYGFFLFSSLVNNNSLYFPYLFAPLTFILLASIIWGYNSLIQRLRPHHAREVAR